MFHVRSVDMLQQPKMPLNFTFLTTLDHPILIRKEDEPERLHTCPNCENVALVYETGYSETSGICFSCGEMPEPGDLVACDECQELCDAERLCGGRCTDCFSAYISQDHT
jgi:hypothetical protein